MNFRCVRCQSVSNIRLIFENSHCSPAIFAYSLPLLVGGLAGTASEFIDGS